MPWDMRLRTTLPLLSEDDVPLRRLLRGPTRALSLVEVEDAGAGGVRSCVMGPREGFFLTLPLSAIPMVLLPTMELANVGRSLFGDPGPRSGESALRLDPPILPIDTEGVWCLRPILTPAVEGDDGRALCPGFTEEIGNGGDERRWFWDPQREVPGLPPILLPVRDGELRLRLWPLFLRSDAGPLLCLLPRLSLLRAELPGSFQRRRCWWHHLPRRLRSEVIRINTVPMRELGMSPLL